VSPGGVRCRLRHQLVRLRIAERPGVAAAGSLLFLYTKLT
jgi:hypothetical protein